ncbi:MAG: hypothetical protein JW720_01215 [Sedimentisphaerales bacterium]|nr:hypothetical protein [Sedimentisphaerales bacterium]
MDEPRKKLKQQITLSVIVICAVMAITGTLFCSDAFAAATPGDENTETKTVSTEATKFALVAAAVAFGLGAIGAGIAISHVGAAAMGAIAEKPQIAGQALIFVALAEGIVVFGFITALMILNKG